MTTTTRQQLLWDLFRAYGDLCAAEERASAQRNLAARENYSRAIDKIVEQFADAVWPGVFTSA